MPNRKVYEERLQEVKANLIEMGKATELLIEQTIKVLKTSDDELARKTIKSDDIVDCKQIEIEKECALLIALQQPIASDLRFILSTIKIITDIERIADQCSDICKYSIMLQNTKWSNKINYQRHTENMALKVKEMLKQALDSLINHDIQAIEKICRDDDKIDDYFWKVWKEIADEMEREHTFIKKGMQYIMIIKYLERMADHVTNIAEWTYYSLTNQYIIHEQFD